MLEKINDVFLYTVFGQDQDRSQGERKKMNGTRFIVWFVSIKTSYWFIEASNRKTRQNLLRKLERKENAFVMTWKEFAGTLGKNLREKLTRYIYTANVKKIGRNLRTIKD
jgi:hypothetical protein